jgi:hypothetical protein
MFCGSSEIYNARGRKIPDFSYSGSSSETSLPGWAEEICEFELGALRARRSEWLSMFNSILAWIC